MFAKLILTILAIAAVWLGFKYYGRFVTGPARRRTMESRRRDQTPPPAPMPGAGPVEGMTQCAVCGAYVPASGVRRCGRPDCPL